MLKKVINTLVYSGLSKQKYKLIKENMDESNRKVNTLVGGLAAIVFFVLLLISVLLPDIYGDSIRLYFQSFFISLAIFIVSALWSKGRVVVTSICFLAFVVLALGTGIHMAVSVSPNERVVTFIVLQVLICIVYYLRPIILMCIVVISDVVLIMSLCNVQSGKLLTDNLTNILAFSFAAIAIGTFIMVLKASKYNQERICNFLIETDGMTDLYNRRSYETELENIRKSKKIISILAFDVNGLKETNDTLGHKAGDELIVGAAFCIKTVFGAYGKCYRIGGDEFMVILENALDLEYNLCREFERTVDKWKGEFVERISVSYGIASTEEVMSGSVDETAILADKRMYKNKITTKNKQMEENQKVEI